MGGGFHRHLTFQQKHQHRQHHNISTMAPSTLWSAADYRSKTMGTVSDAKNNNSYHHGHAAYGGNGNTNMYPNPYPARTQNGQGQAYGMHNSADIAALTHSFQGMGLPNQSFAHQAKNAMMAANGPNYGGMPTNNMPASIYAAPGQFVFPGNYAPNNHAQNANMYTPHVPQYMPQMNYHAYQQHDNSPLSHNWTPTTATTGDVPTLITPRRGSVSSVENDQPATPSYANYANFAQGGVAINRSPSGMYTNTTPSPASMMAAYGIQIAKEMSEVTPRIKMLVAQEPAIPRAIPAPSSPLKPLDRALENQRGETNVYIRGLLPETTDEMLEAWGARFGDIKSSKSIIDLNTGLCKG